MGDDMREAAQEEEKHSEDAAKHIERAVEALKESPGGGEQRKAEIRAAQRSREHAEKIAGLAKERRKVVEESEKQHKKTRRLMEKADEAVHEK
jgi:hypothetical protein